MNIFTALGWAMTKEDFDGLRTELLYRLNRQKLDLSTYLKLMSHIDRQEKEVLDERKSN